MLKTNVITRPYRVILHAPSGAVNEVEIIAESEEAARLKVFVPYGWIIGRVEPC